MLQRSSVPTATAKENKSAVKREEMEWLWFSANEQWYGASHARSLARSLSLSLALFLAYSGKRTVVFSPMQPTVHLRYCTLHPYYLK